MNNYQLYRTNILLGGQMKWDLVLESGTGGLYVDDFHLTPISKYVPFNYKKQEDLLNYSHKQNIKRYYKENSGYFYQNPINPILENDWSDFLEDTRLYNDTVDMGCSRSRDYSLYNKQFEVFVPLWIEHFDTQKDTLSFIISIYSKEDQLLSSKSLELKNIDKSISYHNRFVRYFNEYLDYIQPDDNLVNIDLRGKYANVHGLEVASGNIVTRQDLFIINNLLHRERPLMENDNMIIQLFETNHLISKQLFNFNLCFNIEDILSSILRDQLFGQSFKIKIETKIDETILPIKDFYTNYEFIPKTIINRASDTKDINVLSYMSDDKSIDLINKNKIKNDIIHWSLKDNNDYIFNLYDGFSAVLQKDSDLINMTHRYGTTPDTNIDNYSDELNNIGWINYDEHFDGQKLFDIMKNFYPDIERLGSIFKKGWVNNLYYKGTDVDTELYAYLGICNAQLLAYVKTRYPNQYTEINKDLLYIQYEKESSDMLHETHFLILTTNKHLVTYKNFMNKINSSEEYGAIKRLGSFLSTLQSIPVILLYNSLDITKADSPDIDSQEISYVTKNNCSFIYLERYDGKIVPTFVDKNENFFYYRTKNTGFDTYRKSGYNPLYPSLDYFNIGHKAESGYDIPLYKPDTIEYKWFNAGRSLILIPEIDISFKITNPTPTEADIEKKIKDRLTAIYNIEDKNKINYIYNCYKQDMKYDYDIVIDKNNNTLTYTYTYNIKLILK